MWVNATGGEGVLVAVGAAVPLGSGVSVGAAVPLGTGVFVGAGWPDPPPLHAWTRAKRPRADRRPGNAMRTRRTLCVVGMVALRLHSLGCMISNNARFVAQVLS